MRDSKGKRHDHRQSLWVICNGQVLWCYRCGAWRFNCTDKEKGKWHRPSGLDGANPAMTEYYRKALSLTGKG